MDLPANIDLGIGRLVVSLFWWTLVIAALRMHSIICQFISNVVFVTGLPQPSYDRL